VGLHDRGGVRRALGGHHRRGLDGGYIAVAWLVASGARAHVQHGARVGERFAHRVRDPRLLAAGRRVPNADAIVERGTRHRLRVPPRIALARLAPSRSALQLEVNADPPRVESPATSPSGSASDERPRALQIDVDAVERAAARASGRAVRGSVAVASPRAVLCRPAALAARLRRAQRHARAPAVAVLTRSVANRWLDAHCPGCTSLVW